MWVAAEAEAEDAHTEARPAMQAALTAVRPAVMTRVSLEITEGIGHMAAEAAQRIFGWVVRLLAIRYWWRAAEAAQIRKPLAAVRTITAIMAGGSMAVRKAAEAATTAAVRIAGAAATQIQQGFPASSIKTAAAVREEL